jgi:uncharacterized protein (DUF58 family)
MVNRFGKSGSRSVFFTSWWISGAIFLVLLGMISQERSLSLLGFLTLATAGGSWLWARYSLDRLSYTRRIPAERVFTGETVVLQLSLTNRKLLPLAWLDIEDRFSDRLRVRNYETVPSGVPGFTSLRMRTAMRWFERVTWTIELECYARGHHAIGPVSFRSGDLFGFFSRRAELAEESRIIVYPAIADLQRIGIPARHLFGDQRIRRQIVTDPSRTIGARDYRPEDSFRFIHWKATARTQSLQTRVLEPTTTVQFGIFLNLDTFERYWEGLDYERAEGAIVVAATLAHEALSARQTVGVYANGVVGGSDQPLRVRPSRGLSQEEEILTGLAKLSPLASVNFAAILKAETRRFPIGSTIVVVTAIMTDPVAAILDELSRDGHQLVVVAIGDVAVPAIRRMRVYEIPTDLLRPWIPGRPNVTKPTPATSQTPTPSEAAA